MRIKIPHNRSWYFLLGFCSLILGGCNRRELEEVNPDFQYEYFPLEIGKYRVYQLDSIIFDPAVFGTAVDTFQTYFREVIADTLQDPAGNIQYRVERFSRKKDTDPWVMHSVYAMSRDRGKAYLTEGNLTFVKLVFPVQEGKSWRGTALFDEFREVEVAGERLLLFKGWESKVLEKIPEFDAGSAVFADVWVVQTADFENIIEYRFGREWYARDIGLVGREVWGLDTQCQVCCNGDLGACDGLPWEDRAEKGFILRQRLIGHN